MNGFTLTMIAIIGAFAIFVYNDQEISLEEYKDLDYAIETTNCPFAKAEYKQILKEEERIDNHNKFYIDSLISKCQKKEFVDSVSKS